MLQYFTPDILLAFIGVEKGHVIGMASRPVSSTLLTSPDFHKVFTLYAKTIKGPIHLSSPVTNIGMRYISVQESADARRSF